MLLPRINLIFRQCNRKEGPNEIIRFNHVSEFEFSNDYETLVATGKIILPANDLWCRITTGDLEINSSKDPSAEAQTEIFHKDQMTNIGLDDGEGNLLYNLITSKQRLASTDSIARALASQPAELSNANRPPQSAFEQQRGLAASFKNKEPKFRIGDMVSVICVYYNPITNAPEPDRQFYQEEFVITNLKLENQLEITVANLGWFFKQVPMPNKTINAGENFIDILNSMLDVIEQQFPQQLGIKTNDAGKFIDLQVPDSIPNNLHFNGQIIVNGNLSMAQFLTKLKNDYGLLTYFTFRNMNFPRITQVSDEFSRRYLVDGQEKIFHFQKNIIDSKLEYKTTENLRLSAVVSNTFENAAGGQTRDGFAKTKKKKISLYIEYDPDPTKVKTIVLYDNNGNKTGDQLNSIGAAGADGKDGERRTFVDPSAKNLQDLYDYGISELEKFYYDGYRGDFETFGEPVTFIGDVIQLVDGKHPEKNGKYRVKGVKTTFGTNGYRQHIELDLKIPDTA